MVEIELFEGSVEPFSPEEFGERIGKEWNAILREAEEMAKEENGAEIAAEFRDWIEELKIELEVDDDPEHLVDFINKIGR